MPIQPNFLERTLFFSLNNVAAAGLDDRVDIYAADLWQAAARKEKFPYKKEVSICIPKGRPIEPWHRF